MLEPEVVFEIVISSGVTSSGIVATSMTDEFGRSNYDLINVLSGGTSLSNTTERGARERVHLGGLSLDDIIGGSETVDIGGVVSGAQVVAGGVLSNNGTAEDVTVSSGGELYVPISAGFGQVISAPGLATSTVVFEGVTLLSDAFAEAAVTIASGGEVIEAAGGYIVSGSVAAGGILHASGYLENFVDRGTVIGGTFFGGTNYEGFIRSGFDIQSGAVASRLFDSGLVVVRSGGALRVASVRGASATVYDSGLVTNATLQGGQLFVSSGSALNVRVGSGSTEIVGAGGYTSGVRVAGAGILEMQAGSAAGLTVSSGGAAMVSGAASVSGLTVLSGGLLITLNTPRIVGLSLADGARRIADYEPGSGVTSTNRFISAGEYMKVDSGGVAIGTKVLSGGQIVVSGGGRTTGSVIHGGVVDVVNGGAVESGTVFTGTKVDIASGQLMGSAIGDRVYFGGVLEVTARHSATATKIASGGIVKQDATAKLAGVIVYGGGTLVMEAQHGVTSNLYLGSGAILDIEGVVADSAIDSGGRLVLLSSGAVVSSFTLSHNVSGLTFDVSSDGRGGVEILVSNTPAAAAHSDTLRGFAAAMPAPATVESFRPSFPPPRSELVGLTVRP